MSPLFVSQISQEDPKALVTSLVNSYDTKYGMGSMSCAVYDTAWVSMVEKTVNGKRKWLFPESFHYVVEHQLENGGWECYAAQVDSILNSLAALLAYKKHAAAPELSEDPIPQDLEIRIQKATDFLQQELNNWDVQSTSHVGFEILIPSLFELLEKEGIQFNFKGRDLLMSINKKKLSRLNPAILYKDFKCTAIHSLEAFTGKIDFNRIKHHKTFGSMMASPSSTAAYLINITEWDEESESYLRHVIAKADGKGSGGVPSAFPSTYFEYTWVVCTLLKAGYSIDALGTDNLKKIAEILENGFREENGLLGFAPFVGADADDTAFGLTTLNLIGKSVLADRLVQEFEALDHFKTYSMERNPSLSANCNVLNALLHTPEPEKYMKQIEKCISFLCNQWWISDGKIEDKWNLKEEYTTMLLAQAFIKLLNLWENGILKSFNGDMIRDRVLIVLFQALVRILQSQEPNGSWGDCFEATAYSVIALANLASLPFVGTIKAQIDLAVKSGREFIQSRPIHAFQEYLWIEKVTYGSKSLSKAYTLSALHISVPTVNLGEEVLRLTSIHPKAIMKFTEFFSRLPLYSGTSKWRLQAAVIESYLFLPLVKRVRLDIFPRQGMEEDKYLEYIPFTWTAANNRDNTYLTADFLHEMMVLSMLTYQCDEYMEAVAGRYFEDRLEDIIQMINHLFDESNQTNGEYESVTNGSHLSKHLNGQPLANKISTAVQGAANEHVQPNERIFDDLNRVNSHLKEGLSNHKNVSNGITNGAVENGKGINSHMAENCTAVDAAPMISPKLSTTINSENIESKITETPSIQDVTVVLRKFVHHILDHPKVAQASRFDQERLKKELRIYLLAHVKQSQDNLRFSAQELATDRSVPFETPTSSYYSWVQTTSSDHTSCPFAFAFVSCLLAKDSKDFFTTAEEKYIGEGLCRQLAVTCRQYNDYGSVARDRDEKNLNSINFPEFFPVSGTTSDDELKAELYRIAIFEKKKLDISISALEELCAMNGHFRVAGAIKMFVNVTDTYGQIYMIRDIASRM